MAGILVTMGNTVEATINGNTLAPSSRPIIQNLGPGVLYIGDSQADLSANGLQLPVNCVYEVPAPMVEGLVSLYMYADLNTCDVRILNVG